MDDIPPQKIPTRIKRPGSGLVIITLVMLVVIVIGGTKMACVIHPGLSLCKISFKMKTPKLANAPTDYPVHNRNAGFGEADNEYGKAEKALRSGQHEEAKTHFKKSIPTYDEALTLNPNDINALTARGFAKNRIAPDSGRADLKQVLAITNETPGMEDNVQILWLRGKIYRELKEYGNARKELELALQKKPGNRFIIQDIKILNAQEAQAQASIQP